MIGVVVWSSAEREKAVIWCEDHAALAYLQGRENLVQAACWPQPGDLVELESEVIGRLRNARRVTMLTEQGYADLPAMLRGSEPAPEPLLKIVNPPSDPREQLLSQPKLRVAAAR